MFRKHTASTEGLAETYDYIIIGGGTAGLTVACRLSEDPNLQILVIEAGANLVDDPKILTPGLVGTLYDDPMYDWEFKTVPQVTKSSRKYRECANFGQETLSGRSIPHPRGKVLGGSSVIYQNKITYNSKSGFDAWEKMGNPGWNYESMLPYLRRFHTFHQPTGPIEEALKYSHVDEVLKGDDGPIQTSFTDSFSDTDKDFYKVVKDFVKKENYDETLVGGFASSVSIDPKTRTRSFAGCAYYNDEVASRPNLRVVTEAVVDSIVIESPNDRPRASAVLFQSVAQSFSLWHEVWAKHEVILCAGAFQSPAILERSGIGSADILDSHGYYINIDNPNVGENLQDHAVAAVSFEAAEGVQTADVLGRDPKIMESLIAMYQQDHSGPLGQFFTASAYMPTPSLFGPGGSVELLKILATSSSDPNDKHHEAVVRDLLSQPDGASAHYFMAKIQFDASNAPTITELMTPKRPENYITLLTSQNHPFSRGSVHIDTHKREVSTYMKNLQNHKPAVDPRYLSHPLDIEILARNVQFLHYLISTPPFSQYFKQDGKRIPTNAFHGNREPSLEEAKQIVKDSLISHFHPVGSCAMLPRDKGGVVDTELRVYGVDKLRVVDASIFPLNVRGNPITAVYAVAERAVDIIRNCLIGKGE
ncbi:aryl-alcohol dehydrogenase [Sclerotinia borealis F-4128]|uniref:Aryl-alcohol dehydrogenase n=1 Tax=Sclerotinia borealis (strain F-4128) TaxID=1432307 RepID=W9C8B7_SCLBF|nr:aryl-alcohol dehydrogenase [Sclerotinia borealis F-4128]